MVKRGAWSVDLSKVVSKEYALGVEVVVPARIEVTQIVRSWPGRRIDNRFRDVTINFTARDCVARSNRIAAVMLVGAGVVYESSLQQIALDTARAPDFAGVFGAPFPETVAD